MITPKAITFDINYEVRLQHPLFALGAGGTTMALKKVYEEISPRYYIASSSLRGHNASTFADLIGEVTLLNGASKLSIFGDRYAFSLVDRRDASDVDIFVDCIQLGEKALEGIQDFPQKADSSISFEIKFELNDEHATGTEFSNSIVAWTRQPDFRDLGNLRANHILLTELTSEDQGWTCLLRAGTGAKFPKELLLSFFLTYSEKTVLQSLDQKRQQIEILFERVTTFLGIKALP